MICDLICDHGPVLGGTARAESVPTAAGVRVVTSAIRGGAAWMGETIDVGWVTPGGGEDSTIVDCLTDPTLGSSGETAGVAAAVRIETGCPRLEMRI